MTFMQRPSPDAAFWYFFFMVVILGIVASWPSAGTNSPVLCSISSESERSLVLAWQTSLEGAVGALGPILFTFLCSTVFGYNADCMKDPIPEAAAEECAARTQDDNASAAGQALFWSSCLPWSICGLFYSTMHWSYPRDLATTIAEAEAKEQNGSQMQAMGEAL